VAQITFALLPASSMDVFRKMQSSLSSSTYKIVDLVVVVVLLINTGGWWYYEGTVSSHTLQ
jgi:hypothetical protein